MSTVYLLTKHPRRLYEHNRFSNTATVEGVFAKRAKAQRIADENNVGSIDFQWKVRARRIRA